jgi:chromosome partitioning protein
MRTILIASRKGGVGKTTVAVHMAALADKPGKPALLVDADPQASAKFWYDRREAETPLLAVATASGARAILDDARAAGIETAIIDSPPFDAAGINSLMRLADFVVIVTRPGVLDLAAVSNTINMALSARVPFAVLLNAAPPPRAEGGEPSLVAEARQALEAMGAPVLPAYVSQRADLAHSLITGSAVHEHAPDSRAATEIAAAWRTINRIMETGVPAHGREARKTSR